MYHEVDNFPITELSTMFSSFHIISDCADTGDSFHTCKKKKSPHRKFHHISNYKDFLNYYYFIFSVYVEQMPYKSL